MFNRSLGYTVSYFITQLCVALNPVKSKVRVEVSFCFLLNIPPWIYYIPLPPSKLTTLHFATGIYSDVILSLSRRKMEPYVTSLIYLLTSSLSTCLPPCHNHFHFSSNIYYIYIYLLTIIPTSHITASSVEKLETTRKIEFALSRWLRCNEWSISYREYFAISETHTVWRLARLKLSLKWSRF